MFIHHSHSHTQNRRPSWTILHPSAILPLFHAHVNLTHAHPVCQRPQSLLFTERSLPKSFLLPLSLRDLHHAELTGDPWRSKHMALFHNSYSHFNQIQGNTEETLETQWKTLSGTRKEYMKDWRKKIIWAFNPMFTGKSNPTAKGKQIPRRGETKSPQTYPNTSTCLLCLNSEENMPEHYKSLVFNI